MYGRHADDGSAHFSASRIDSSPACCGGTVFLTWQNHNSGPSDHNGDARMFTLAAAFELAGSKNSRHNFICTITSLSSHSRNLLGT